MERSYTKITKTLKKLLKNKNTKVKFYSLLKLWPEITGGKISDFALPYDLKAGILYIAVNNKMWQQELTYAKDQLLQKFKKHNIELKDIYFKYRKLPAALIQPISRPSSKKNINDIQIPDEKLDCPVSEPSLAKALIKLKTTWRKSKELARQNDSTDTVTETITRNDNNLAILQQDDSSLSSVYFTESDFLKTYDEFQVYE